MITLPNRVFSTRGIRRPVGCVLCLFVASVSFSRCTAEEASRAVAYQKAIAGRIRQIADEVLPSIVSVEVIGVMQSDGEVRQDAPTTGVIVGQEGFILASSWVARSQAASIIVTAADGTRFPARIVGRDEHRELVLLKIDPKGTSLKPLDFSAADATPAIGSTVVAMARYGESNVPIVSSGIMSAVDRLDGTAIQSDVRISPTFYGGPLLDLQGRVIGVLIPAVGENGAEDPTAWYDSGIAFAVPSQVIAAKLDRMKNGETIQAGLLGLVVGGSDPYAPGTTIATIRKRSPADRAGLKEGDELVRVGDRSVQRRQDIKLALGRYDAGDEIELQVKRSGELQDIAATLVASIEPLQPQLFGVALDGLTVASVLPGYPADEVLHVGDILETLEGVKVEDSSTLRQRLWAADPTTELNLGIVPASSQDARTASDSESDDLQAKVVAITPRNWAGELSASMIESLTTSVPSNEDGKATGGSWAVTEVRLPDVPNKAVLWHPEASVNAKSAQANRKAENDASAESPLSTALAIVLLPPSQREPSKELLAWKQLAQTLNVAVCLVASEDSQRWQLSEIEAISKLTASALKQSSADPDAVAVISSGILSLQNESTRSKPADAMALAVSLSTENVYHGVAIPGNTQPPAIRLRRDAPMRLLRVLLTVEEDSEKPAWTAALTRIGCPMQTTDRVDHSTLLGWCRSLLVL